jgi:alpha-L-fucosidase 2
MKQLLFVLLAVVLPAFAQMRTDIVFARRGSTSLTLDAWVPEGAGPFAAVIIVHGGGFIAGDKQTYVKPLFPILTDAGFAWFTINYRLAPASKFPEPVTDVEDAVRWVMKNAKQYKVDARRVALTGESAGGHLVSYIAVTSASKLGLRAVVPIYAPHDLLARAKNAGKPSDNIQKFVGVGPELTPENIAKLEKASPYYHAQPKMPPILLIHGTKDAQVPYEQSVDMQKKLSALGVRCDLFTVPDGAHGMGSWAKLPSQEWKSYLVSWLRSVLQ